MSNLQQERTEIFNDVYSGKIPKRVPITVDIDMSYAIQYAGLSLRTAQYDWDLIELAYDNICKALYDCDMIPVSMYRFPALYQMLESKVFMMSDTGFIQHPEVSAMSVDEYGEFIKDPYKFLLEVALPRLNGALNKGSAEDAKNLAMAYYMFNDLFFKNSVIEEKMVEKYNYAIRPTLTGNVTPVDFIAASLRGFSKIASDFRRCPKLIAEAAEALLPMQKMMGTLIPGHSEIYLHMPPFISEKAFTQCYWTTFKEMVDYLVENGQTVRLWCERDWMRYLDYLALLPDNVCLYFELGDAKLAKEKLGTKKVISGLYPSEMFRTATPDECADKAKEIMDTLAPGGGYIFCFDRGVLSLQDANMGCVQKVLKTVKEYGVY